MKELVTESIRYKLEGGMVKTRRSNELMFLCREENYSFATCMTDYR
jgi:hypothetical protein